MGDFTTRIDMALVAGDIDLAVHSAKDLPARDAPATVVAAYPRRADPSDCLVLRKAKGYGELPPNSRIGTSSPRRVAQMHLLRPDIRCVSIRGNIGTRLSKMTDLGLDGLVLATAGLTRLGLGQRITQRLDPLRFLPAPGQGALAITTRRKDSGLRTALTGLDHRSTHLAVEAERAVAWALGGDCELPLGCFGRVRGGALALRAGLAQTVDGPFVRLAEVGPAEEAKGIGRSLGRRLRRQLLRGPQTATV